MKATITLPGTATRKERPVFRLSFIWIESITKDGAGEGEGVGRKTPEKKMLGEEGSSERERVMNEDRRV